MDIYVAKNEQKHGPYTPAEVQARLASGQFLGSDLGWRDGVVDWLPLSQLLASLPVRPAEASPPPLKSSGLAKSSFIIGMIGIGAWIVTIVAAGVADSSGAGETSPFMITIGLLMFAFLAANLAGLILGLVTLAKPITNKWMAIAGVITNGLEILGFVLLLIVGLTQ